MVEVAKAAVQEQAVAVCTGHTGYTAAVEQAKPERRSTPAVAAV